MSYLSKFDDLNKAV